MQWILNILKRCERSPKVYVLKSKLRAEYSYIKKVISSCKTREQLNSAHNMIDNWYDMRVIEVEYRPLCDYTTWDLLSDLYNDLIKICEIHINLIK